jgi:hypothetical protein
MAAAIAAQGVRVWHQSENGHMTFLDEDIVAAIELTQGRKPGSLN